MSARSQLQLSTHIYTYLDIYCAGVGLGAGPLPRARPHQGDQRGAERGGGVRGGGGGGAGAAGRGAVPGGDAGAAQEEVPPAGDGDHAAAEPRHQHRLHRDLAAGTHVGHTAGAVITLSLCSCCARCRVRGPGPCGRM